MRGKVVTTIEWLLWRKAKAERPQWEQRSHRRLMAESDGSARVP
jgi:hypothetical protein